MGGVFGKNVTENNTSIKNTANNTINSSVNNACNITVNETISDVKVVISNSVAQGINIEIDQGGKFNALQPDCTIRASVSSVLNNLSSIQNQQTSQSTQGILSILSRASKDVNKSSLEQSTTNYVTNLLTNTCNVDKNLTVTDIVLVLNNTVLKGDIDIAIRNQNPATCKINSMSKVGLYNSNITNNAQTAKIESSVGNIIFLVVVAVIVLAVVGGLVAMSKVFTSHKNLNPQGPPNDPFREDYPNINMNAVQPYIQQLLAEESSGKGVGRKKNYSAAPETAESLAEEAVESIAKNLPEAEVLAAGV